MSLQVAKWLTSGLQVGDAYNQAAPKAQQAFDNMSQQAGQTFDDLSHQAGRTYNETANQASRTYDQVDQICSDLYRVLWISTRFCRSQVVRLLSQVPGNCHLKVYAFIYFFHVGGKRIPQGWEAQTCPHCGCLESRWNGAGARPRLGEALL